LADIPSDVQFALIVPAGTYPEAHMKDITAPTNVLEILPMEPYRGAVGIPQLTGRKKVIDSGKQLRGIQTSTTRAHTKHFLVGMVATV